MQSRLVAFGLFVCLLSGSPGPWANEDQSGQQAFVAIIVDDLGHNLMRGERAISLPTPVTVAMIPQARHSTELARRAAIAGHEVMIHMPMASVYGRPLEAGSLFPDMPRQDLIRILDEAFARVPNARGLNNHMGSLLTTRTLEMGWLMEEIKRRELFFIDSRTTTETVARRIASEHSVQTSSRDIFLDNEPSFEAIDAEFERLIDTAIKRGTAIAIGHPHPATLAYLEQKLPGLSERGIRVVPVSHAIKLQRILAARTSPAASVATD
ncbi:MAG: divergent polysaccharide deacetylase family protein [Gammaproteobacteria bacterium]|nr:divergent polysaccharide deacetylase family protein [Gammaproteobacteria bacterium]